MKSFKPLYFLVAFILIVGLACIGSGTTPEPSQPTSPPPVQQPTDAPQQPATEAPQQPVEPQQPTEEPQQPTGQKFFTEEFDSPLSSDWTLFTVTGSDSTDPEKFTMDVKNGKLIWKFDDKQLYEYLFYTAHEYDDVTVEARVDNRGKNNNNVSLICRYDPDTGWYEFNIANNGLYDILYAEVQKDGDINYSTITNGGSNAIKAGKEINEYSITCKGAKLSLHINGKETNSITEKKYALRSGGIGVSVSAFNVLPIEVEMDWIKILEP